jgi:hypothetical protein
MSAVKHFLMADIVPKVYRQQQFREFSGDFSPLLIYGLGAT